MRLRQILASICFAIHQTTSQAASQDRNISMALFSEIEELARIVDISYCTLLFTSGISQPFTCWSRCPDFPSFELVKDWRTGLSWRIDGGGYVALDHAGERTIVAFRGTINLAGMVADLRLSPHEYTPFPGAEDQATGKTLAGNTDTYTEDRPECPDCTVHTGFYRAWNETRPHIISAVREQRARYPHLGAAVSAFAALDFNARGWEPVITTFGEPRVGNLAMNRHIDRVFDLTQDKSDYANDDQRALRWRRVTHTNDPIPLLPPTEWGYAMHGGEIFIAKPSLSPSIHDLRHCHGASDRNCIAGEDPTYPSKLATSKLQQRGLWGALKEDVPELLASMWKWDLPHRYRVWEVLVAHRDYFWRLGLCVPGGDPTGGGGEFPELEEWRAEHGMRQTPGPAAEAAREIEKEVEREL